jgi:hypothetical protein
MPDRRGLRAARLARWTAGTSALVLASASLAAAPALADPSGACLGSGGVFVCSGASGTAETIGTVGSPHAGSLTVTTADDFSVDTAEGSALTIIADGAIS